MFEVRGDGVCGVRIGDVQAARGLLWGLNHSECHACAERSLTYIWLNTHIRFETKYDAALEQRKKNGGGEMYH